MWFFRLFPLLALLLLSGCQHSPHPAEARAENGAGNSEAQSAWLNELQQRVSHSFDRADRYRGQRCDVTIGYDRRRGYQVLRTEGDEALCLKAWQAVSRDRQLPVPPPGAPAQVMIAFRPA